MAEEKNEKEKTSEKVPGAAATAVTIEIGLAGHTPSKKISVSLPPGDPRSVRQGRPPADRQAPPAPRRAAEGHRPRRLHARRHAAGHALRAHPPLAPRPREDRVDRHVEAREDAGVVFENAGQEEGALPRRGGPRARGRRRAQPPTTRFAPSRSRTTSSRTPSSLVDARKDGAPLVFQKPVEEKRTRRRRARRRGGAVAQTGNVRGPKTSGQGRRRRRASPRPTARSRS